MTIFLKPELKIALAESEDPFAEIMALEGRVYRELEGRRTQRVVLNDQAYFVKQHTGVGWKEILKNLFQFRLPIVSAKQEYLALKRLLTLHIPVAEIVGFGKKGMNPAKIQSFLITRELPKHLSLEYLTKTWNLCSPSFRLKNTLIKTVAHIARTLHNNGMNHRDFYLCHFLLDLEKYSEGNIHVYLIDLHRAGIRFKTPERWVIKDLAGLAFSSHDIGLTRRDYLRFIKEYRKNPLSDILPKESSFWRKVKERGDKLYQKETK